MCTLDTNLATTLIDEVVEWARSDTLFVQKEMAGQLERQFGMEKISCVIKDGRDFLRAIDVTNEQTSYQELDEIIEQIESYYRTVDSFSPLDFSHSIIDKVSAACESVGKQSSVRQLAEAMTSIERRCGGIDEMSAHIATTVARHLSAVIYARALTLSRRYGPTEMVFLAYRKGLFPFGWSWENAEVLCVDPSRVG
ncbi:MAG: hypothetical protein NTY19_23550 [Planctomycetota bacterium]|nr:hypothetical protein [Planctomycetota bacterium]